MQNHTWFGFGLSIACLAIGYGISKLEDFRRTSCFIITECVIAFLPFYLGNVQIVHSLCGHGKCLMRLAYIFGSLAVLVFSLGFWKLYGVRHLEDAVCGSILSIYLSGLYWVIWHRSSYSRWNRILDEELLSAARGAYPWHADLTWGERRVRSTPCLQTQRLTITEIGTAPKACGDGLRCDGTAG